MPARRTPHDQGGYIKASFVFAFEGLGFLTPARVVRIIARIVPPECLPNGRLFAEYLCVVERGPRAGTCILPAIVAAEVPPGEVLFTTLEEVQGVLDHKYEHELQKHRIPGHESYRPPQLLKPETCALVIGSRPFLYKCAELYLERKGILRRHMLTTGYRICALAEASHRDTRPEDSTFCRVPEQGTLRVWGGNFDALWHKATRQRLSADDLAAHLREAAGGSAEHEWSEAAHEDAEADPIP